MCRSVHAEQNAIISAARKDLLDSILYLVGREAATGEYVKNAMPCILCKRFIINAGISRVIIRNDDNNYTTVDVKEWIDNDESLEGKFGY
jgi:dCMP deaminase